MGLSRGVLACPERAITLLDDQGVDVTDAELRRLAGLDLLGPPVSGFCDKFQAATPSRALLT